MQKVLRIFNVASRSLLCIDRILHYFHHHANQNVLKTLLPCEVTLALAWASLNWRMRSPCIRYTIRTLYTCSVTPPCVLHFMKRLHIYYQPYMYRQEIFGTCI